MQVYIRYRDMWLKLKEARELAPQPSKRRRQRRTAPYGLVAESVDALKLNGLRKVYEVVVPATKVSRFAARLLKEKPDTITVLISPGDGEDYVAEFYASSAGPAAQQVKAIVDKVFSELKVAVEEEVEGVEEEPEDKEAEE